MPSGVQATQPSIPSDSQTTTVVPETQPQPSVQEPETAPPQETQQPAQSVTFKKGDCNGDGSVTILDMLLINQHVMGQNVLSGEAKEAADMNGDGKITSEDADAVKKIIFG